MEEPCTCDEDACTCDADPGDCSCGCCTAPPEAFFRKISKIPLTKTQDEV